MNVVLVKCCIFGGTKSKTARNNGGAPKFIMPKEVLQNLMDDDCLISEIGNILFFSERTVYRRIGEYNLSKTLQKYLMENFASNIVELI